MVVNTTQHQSNIAQLLVAVVMLWTMLGGVSLANGFDLQHALMLGSTAVAHNQEQTVLCDGSEQCGTPSVVDCLAHCFTTAPAAHADAMVISLVVVLIATASIVQAVIFTRHATAPHTRYFPPLYQFATIHLKE